MGKKPEQPKYNVPIFPLLVSRAQNQRRALSARLAELTARVLASTAPRAALHGLVAHVTTVACGLAAHKTTIVRGVANNTREVGGGAYRIKEK